MNMKINIKGIRKILDAIIPALCMCLCALIAPVYAEDTLNEIQKGSISVTIKAYATDEAISGGILDLYQIAYVSENELIYTEDFSDCEESLLLQESLEKADTADFFESYAAAHEVSAFNTIEVGLDGSALFDNLEQGLYMVAQDAAANGYEAINAFLVTVPMNEDGTYIYDIDASPKATSVSALKSSGRLDSTTPVSVEPVKTDESVEIQESSAVISSADDISGNKPKTSDEFSGFVFGAMILSFAVFSIISYIRHKSRERGEI